MKDSVMDSEMFYGYTLSDEQLKFVQAIYDPKNLAVLCNAMAGTGKTLLALGAANILVQKGIYDKIYYIMSPTQEQIQGYLPGSQEEKSLVYADPMFQALISLGINPHTAVISDNNMSAQKNGKAYISFMTHTYMRGTNLSDSVVILDEAQNYFTDSLRKVLTRIHDSCKTIVIGHSGQIDIIKHPERSGFTRLLELFEQKGSDFSEIVTLTKNYRGKVSLLADELE